MKKILTAFGLGAGVMYMFDPRSRARRRAVLRDKLLHHMRNGVRIGDIVARDLMHRSQGVIAEFSNYLGQLPPDDEILVAQVRSRLGRLVSSPHSIEVLAKQGRITLDGHCSSDELPRAVRAVARMRNVHGVVNRLTSHSRHRKGATRSMQPVDIFNKNWSPATRFLVTLGAGATALYGMRGKGIRGLATATAGLFMGVRAMTNREISELLSPAPLRPGSQPKLEIEPAKTRTLEPVPTPKPQAA